MVLPPLELFSLRKELPCCRVALSVFEGSSSSFFRFSIRVFLWLGPLLAADFT
jgi:hypothetical protein